MATRKRWAAVFTSVELDVIVRSCSKFGPFSIKKKKRKEKKCNNAGGIVNTLGSSFFAKKY